MVIRSGPGDAVVPGPRPDDAALLTEAQVRGGGPVARLVAARPWIMDLVVAGSMAVLGVVGAAFAFETAAGARALGLYAQDDVTDVVTGTWLVGAAVAPALLLARRARPLLVTALLLVTAVASLLVAGVVGVAVACLACALYSVAASHSPRTTWMTFGAVLVVLTVALWRWQDLGLLETLSWSGAGTGQQWDPTTYFDEPPFSPGRRSGDVLLLLALLLLGVTTGSATRARRLHTVELVERYRAMARERDQSAELARASERAHIAREMHDVVAHSLSVMVALSDGADAAFERAPERSREALREAGRTGRAALADMQRVLGALGPVAHDRRAEPTEVDLATLVARFGAVGLPVTASGTDVALPADTSVRLAVLRVVGEALTNVLRHAPGTASVHVALRRTPSAVEVDVVDSGGTRPAEAHGTGRGVVGMQERAALLGGHVEAGPRPGGGWRVHAVIPCADEDGGRA
ncbi:sensor histidine kinase [Cellulomonas massiliensis]|uniref:sensor histidine kinase n=1 Tax=Cellulomonas massiliensis TaxID=1465811 RepID=UPI0003677E97|nr:histidine kinase [Cellulomonas massiliensis]